MNHERSATAAPTSWCCRPLRRCSSVSRNSPWLGSADKDGDSPGPRRTTGCRSQPVMPHQAVEGGSESFRDERDAPARPRPGITGITGKNAARAHLPGRGTSRSLSTRPPESVSASVWFPARRNIGLSAADRLQPGCRGVAQVRRIRLRSPSGGLLKRGRLGRGVGSTATRGKRRRGVQDSEVGSRSVRTTPTASSPSAPLNAVGEERVVLLVLPHVRCRRDQIATALGLVARSRTSYTDTRRWTSVGVGIRWRRSPRRS